jgi:hypothetical protein
LSHRPALVRPEGWAWSSDAATLTDGQPWTLYPPPEHRGPPDQPKRRPTVWPPVPCDHSALVTYEYFPGSQPFVTIPATGMRLAVAWHDPDNPSVFELFVNPRISKADAQGNMLYRFPSMRPAAAYRLSFGFVGNADVTYESLDGQTYYIRCRGAGRQRKEGYDQVSYRFEVQW